MYNPMKIFFIRHGETTGDVENRYGGSYDDHLSEKGLLQCATLTEQLEGKGIEKIYVSSLARAQETAKIISEKLECEVEIVPDLRERNQYGILTGMKKEEAKEKYPVQVELLKDRLNTIEEAESYETFSQRIQDAFMNVVSNTDHSSVALVSHGGPMRVLFRDILKWGELKEIGDCSFIELLEQDGNFFWVDAVGLVPAFSITDHLANTAMDRDT